MTAFQHALRIALVMAAAAVLLAWELRHSEASTPDGLRSIRQAEEIARGAWREGLIGAVDHPLHPLGIVAMHGIVGGDGPVAWQRAAVALGFAGLVLLAIPSYLLTLELYGERTAWLGGLLLVTQPVLARLMSNVLSETTFLPLWTWGVWTALRFLRNGRFGWLAVTVVLGVLSYLARPEGFLLPVALAATLLLLPLLSSARIHWPRWRCALGLVFLGSLLLTGPYLVLEGKLGTRPAVARVLGLAPPAHPDAPEREHPLPPGQTGLEIHAHAVGRTAQALLGLVPIPLVLLAVVGVTVLPGAPERSRTWLLLGIILVLSCVGLVRLHATGGYVTPRHALIPGSLLFLAAAHGLRTLVEALATPAARLGLDRGQYRPGPAVWSLVIATFVAAPRWTSPVYSIPGPFNVYQDAAVWLRANTAPGEEVLDLTDWSLYFSGCSGRGVADFHQACAEPGPRWVVVHGKQLEGHRKTARALRGLTGGRPPAATIPARVEPGQLQLLIFDRSDPSRVVAAAGATDEPRAEERR